MLTNRFSTCFGAATAIMGCRDCFQPAIPLQGLDGASGLLKAVVLWEPLAVWVEILPTSLILSYAYGVSSSWKQNYYGMISHCAAALHLVTRSINSRSRPLGVSSWHAGVMHLDTYGRLQTMGVRPLQGDFHPLQGYGWLRNVVHCRAALLVLMLLILPADSLILNFVNFSLFLT